MQFVRNMGKMRLRNKIFLGIVSLFVLLCLCVALSPGGKTSTSATATPQAEVVAQVTSKPQLAASPTLAATATSIPATMTPAPSATAGPTDTPAPTNTPLPTETPEPTPAPAVFDGTGDSIVDVPAHQPSIIHIVGNKSSRFFAVESIDADNNQIDLLVNTTDVYDGYRPLDFRDGQATARLKISANGAWHIEIIPLVSVRRENVPGTITGKGDDVVYLANGKPDTAKITGNKGARFFAVTSYSSGGSIDLLVNTTDVYAGQVLLTSDTIILEVQAVGDWSIDVAAK